MRRARRSGTCGSQGGSCDPSPTGHAGGAPAAQLRDDDCPYYIRAVEQFAKHFKRPPDQLNQTHLRTYQAYLLRERKLEPRTVKLHVSALRFFFVKTLKRPYLLDDIPYPKVPRRLPTILTVEEVTRLIDAARTLTDRTMLMVLYSTGMRNAEMRTCRSRTSTAGRC